jgi:hypothetical protein
MAPYVPLLMPELQKALLDPLPEVRATAARAMGSLLKGMGPAALGDLLPWLLTTLRSEGSSVERSGAAQVRGCGVWVGLETVCGCVGVTARVGATPVALPCLSWHPCVSKRRTGRHLRL